MCRWQVAPPEEDKRCQHLHMGICLLNLRQEDTGPYWPPKPGQSPKATEKTRYLCITIHDALMPFLHSSPNKWRTMQQDSYWKRQGKKCRRQGVPRRSPSPASPGLAPHTEENTARGVATVATHRQRPLTPMTQTPPSRPRDTAYG